jgi:hypothetical protein
MKTLLLDCIISTNKLDTKIQDMTLRAENPARLLLGIVALNLDPIYSGPDEKKRNNSWTNRHDGTGDFECED